MPISFSIIFLLHPLALFLSNELTNEFSSGCCVDCAISLLYISTSSLSVIVARLWLVQLARFHRLACCVISCVCRTIAPFRWDWATAKLLSFSLNECVCWCHCVMAKVWHVTKAWACWEWRRKAGKLALSRDVGRKMASRNNDAYIYEIYAWHPLEFDLSLSVCVCVQCMCETLISRLPSWEGLLRFFLILIFNLNKRKVSFFCVCQSRRFYCVRGRGSGG